MHKYFKRQLKTPTYSVSFRIHLQGVLNVLHWNYLWCFMCVVGVWQRELVAPDTHTTGPNFTLPNTDYAHKTSQVILVKHL